MTSMICRGCWRLLKISLAIASSEQFFEFITAVHKWYISFMGHIGGQMDSNCCAREIRAQSLHSKVVPNNWDFDL